MMSLSRTSLFCLCGIATWMMITDGSKMPTASYFNSLSETNTIQKTGNVAVQYSSEPLYVSRSASLYARLAQPIVWTPAPPAGPRFFLRHTHPAIDITENAGILYVSDPRALRQSSPLIQLAVEWGSGSAQLTVRLVETPACHDHDHVESLCSAQTQRQCVRTSCAYGLGRISGLEKAEPRCEWVWDTMAVSVMSPTPLGYATCTVDVTTCPDGVCDPLERLSGNLTCLQDCTQSVLGAGRVREVGHGVSPLTSGTFCSCDHLGTCSCAGLASASRGTQTSLPTAPSDTNYVPKTKKKEGCGFKCQTKAAIGIIFIMSSFLFLLLLFIYRQQKRKSGRKHFESSNILLRTLDTTQRPVDSLINVFHPLSATFGDHFIVPDPRWEFPRENLEIQQCLGEGEFGRVLKACATNINGVEGKTVVAVKTVKEGASVSEMEVLLSEYQLMKDVSHLHVIRLLGACTSPGPLYVIIEFAEHGSLRTYLRRSRLESMGSEKPVVPPLSYQTLLAFACQICRGMSYLADNKVVHRDLAARNVLVVADRICKVSDFGLSRDVYEDEAYLKRSKGRVPVKWMALESLADHVYTSKSDVWSYGVLLWELVTLGSTPYPGVAGHSLYSLLRSGYRLDQPPTCTDALYELMCDCWLEDPKERPPFWQICGRLERLVEEGADYLPLQLEKKLFINRAYFCDLSPDDDFEGVEKDFGYKTPNPKMVVQAVPSSSLVNPLENEKALETHYDSPRRLDSLFNEFDSQNVACLKDVGFNNYTVLKNRISNQYENDAQMNINYCSKNKTPTHKEIEYDKNKLHLLSTDKEDESNISDDINDAVHRPTSDYYLNMDLRTSSVDVVVASRSRHVPEDPRRNSCAEENPASVKDIERYNNSFLVEGGDTRRSRGSC